MDFDSLLLFFRSFLRFKSLAPIPSRVTCTALRPCPSNNTPPQPFSPEKNVFRRQALPAEFKVSCRSKQQNSLIKKFETHTAVGARPMFSRLKCRETRQKAATIKRQNIRRQKVREPTSACRSKRNVSSCQVPCRSTTNFF